MTAWDAAVYCATIAFLWWLAGRAGEYQFAFRALVVALVAYIAFETWLRTH